MKTLIIGSGGLVGSALSRRLPNALKTNHDLLDITNYDALFKVFSEERPQLVYLSAANANVDACESKSTDQTNISGSLLVLRLCEMFGAKLVWFSSGYVFNGFKSTPYMEQDFRDPIQNYGRQKAHVEQMIVDSHHPSLIIRTIGVFGEEKGKKNFVKSVAASVTGGRKVFAPTDQYMNPILSTDLTDIVIGLANNQNGIFHVAGDQVISKYEYALMVADWFGKSSMVEGVTSDKLKQRAMRPRMAALDCTEINRLGYRTPSMAKALIQYLDNEYS
jgi:dTDP-4-dehydrorhamnose reductase